MRLKNYNVYFLFLILIIVTAISFFLIKSLLVAFIVASILAHSFGPFYEKVLKFTGGRKIVSSTLICLLVGFIIFVPLILIGILLYSEVQMAVLEFSRNPEKLMAVVTAVNNYIHSIHLFPQSRFFQNFQINENFIYGLLNNFYSYLSVLIQGVYMGLGYLVIMAFVFFFCLFYLLMDRKTIVANIFRLSPLRNKYDRALLDKFYSISRATIKGTFFLSALQGFLGGVLFWAVGIHSPVVLAILMTITAIIPPVGSSIIWFPVAIVMMLLGNIQAGIIILLVGFLVITTTDNILRPKLVGKDTEMHPIIILLSTLGGLQFFGLYGFVIGPLILSFCVALWEIYSVEFKGQLKNFNK